MDLRQLRYFVAVAHLLNFSRAAESLHISQSTLSQQIAELEAELGGPLFLRNKRSVRITGAGMALLEEGESLLYQFDDMARRISQMNHAEQEAQTLSIGVDTYDEELERLNVISAIAELHRTIPTAVINLKTVPYKASSGALRHHDIDVGLYTVPAGAEQELTAFYRVLQRERISLIVSNEVMKEHQDWTASDIIQSMTLYLQTGDVRWNSYFIQTIQRICPGAKYDYADSFQMISNYVDLGMGYYGSTDALAGNRRRKATTDIEITDDRFGACNLAIFDPKDKNPLLSLFLERL